MAYSQSILDSEVNISGYTLVRQDRDDRSCGGTAIFVREGIPYLHRKDLSNDDSEICWIEVCRPNCKKQFICSVYKPPTYCCDSLINELNLSLARVLDNAEIIILGDFNIDFSATKKDPVYKFKQKLQTFAHLHNFEQLIKTPTRVSELTQSTIDLIFTNHYHRTVESGVIPCAISDHSLIYCTAKSGVSKGPPRIIEYRSYRTYDKNAFINDLKEVDWDLVTNRDNINSALNGWNEMFLNIANRHAPLKQTRVKGIQIPWIQFFNAVI